ncbi:DinB family protein [Nocardioides ferulae]|uniref:DinB family protein n=1 Tax=Nocardioides ferulae TaxID=2340821 RepID=UPI000EAB5837|nr:DinB family protein [Nocardioides ferulae]
MTITESHPTTPTATASSERADLLETLRKHRDFLRFTVRGLTDEQAGLTPTASELCLGGLIKHVTAVERKWADYIVNGPAEPTFDWATVDWSNPPEEIRARMADFAMQPGETLAGVLAAYDEAAAVTDGLVATVDLDARHPLPKVPWFEPGGSWSARRVFLHVIAESSQHAGHADIIRETIDGQKTMG